MDRYRAQLRSADYDAVMGDRDVGLGDADVAQVVHEVDRTVGLAGFAVDCENYHGSVWDSASCADVD